MVGSLQNMFASTIVYLCSVQEKNHRVVLCSPSWETERKPSYTGAVMVSCFQAMWLMMKPSHCL